MPTMNRARAHEREFDTFSSHEKHADGIFPRFFPPHSWLPLSRRHSRAPLLSRAFHFIITVCPLPVIPLSIVSLAIRSSCYSFSRSRCLHRSLACHRLRLPLSPSISVCIYIYTYPSLRPFTPLCVPLFLSLNFLSLTQPPTRRVWSIRKQCRGRSRASALFSLNKFNLNFPAVRNVY